MAHWLTLMAVALFALNGAVLAVGANAYGWASLLFATAAFVGLATGALRRPLRSSAGPARPAQDTPHRRLARSGAGMGGTADALR